MAEFLAILFIGVFLYSCFVIYFRFQQKFNNNKIILIIITVLFYCSPLLSLLPKPENENLQTLEGLLVLICLFVAFWFSFILIEIYRKK